MGTNPDDQNTARIDLPGSAHNGGCGFNVADGHSETKRWKDAPTKMPVRRQNFEGRYVPGSVDIRWVIEPGTAPR